MSKLNADGDENKSDVGDGWRAEHGVITRLRIRKRDSAAELRVEANNDDVINGGRIGHDG